MARINLVPQRREFYDLYNAAAANTVEISGLLERMLGGALDDICDHVDETAGYIVGYGVTQIRDKAKQQAAIIHRAATKLQEAVSQLEGFRDSSRQLIELRELEDE